MSVSCERRRKRMWYGACRSVGTGEFEYRIAMFWSDKQMRNINDRDYYKLPKTCKSCVLDYAMKIRNTEIRLIMIRNFYIRVTEQWCGTICWACCRGATHRTLFARWCILTPNTRPPGREHQKSWNDADDRVKASLDKSWYRDGTPLFLYITTR